VTFTLMLICRNALDRGDEHTLQENATGRLHALSPSKSMTSLRGFGGEIAAMPVGSDVLLKACTLA
jgi:hypothetical protein